MCKYSVSHSVLPGVQRALSHCLLSWYWAPLKISWLHLHCLVPSDIYTYFNILSEPPLLQAALSASPQRGAPAPSASRWPSNELFPVCPGFSSPWGLRTGHCAPGTQWCWVEGKDHLSRPTGYTLPNLAKNTVSLLSGKDTLLASVQPGVYQDSSVLSCRANFQLGWPSACITLLTLDHPTTNVLMICLSEVFTRYDCTLDKCSLQLPIFKIKLFSVHQKPVSEMGLSFSWELLHVAPDIFTVFLTHSPIKWKMLVWAAR